MAGISAFSMDHRITPFLRKTIAAILLAVSATVCGHASSNSGAPIQFTKIPPSSPGGPTTMGSIAGKITGPHEGLKLVLYAKSGRWYIQPYADHPFIAINNDSTWSSPTHLGTDYAALLVQPDYVPPFIVDKLPGTGGGVVALSVTEGTPPVWQAWWFRLLAVLLAISVMLAFYRWRMHRMARQLNLRFEERLAERTRIAQELHDTLLQGLLSISMQIHVAADQLADDSPARVTLDRAKQLMSQVVDEGQNTIRGLRSPIQNPDELVSSLSQIPRELNETRVSFRVLVEGSPLPLRSSIRDEVYRIGREALMNAFRHSHAFTVILHVEYAADHLRIVVEDNGCGIDSSILQSPRDRHWGLSGMREHAEKIGGKLKIMSRPGLGTEVEFRLPGSTAFESAPSGLNFRWLGKFHHRPNEEELTPQ